MAPSYNNFEQSCTESFPEQSCPELVNPFDEICTMNEPSAKRIVEALEKGGFLGIDFLTLSGSDEIYPFTLAMRLTDTEGVLVQDFSHVQLRSALEMHYFHFKNGEVKNNMSRAFGGVINLDSYMRDSRQDFSLELRPVVGNAISKKQVERIQNLVPDSDCEIYEVDRDKMFEYAPIESYY